MNAVLTEPDTRTTVLRALRCRCPQCGEAPLFKSYLKQVDACASCGTEYGHIRADDGPAWLTIVVVGHIVGTLVLAFDAMLGWSDWASTALWVAIAVGLIIVMLPSAKALFIAFIRRNGMPGSERA